MKLPKRKIKSDELNSLLEESIEFNFVCKKHLFLKLLSNGWASLKTKKCNHLK